MHAWIKLKTTLLFGLGIALGCMGFVACQEPSPKQKVEPEQMVISMKIPPLPTALASSASKSEEEPFHLAIEAELPLFPSFALEPYSPADKINPFIPLIQASPKATIAKDKGEKKSTRTLTPLEKFDLSQIRLVAVVLAESGKIAMVEEASGKGYVVKVGTYVGKDSGKVVQILPDRIVIDETVTDLRGESISRTREMKIRKQEVEG